LQGKHLFSVPNSKEFDALSKDERLSMLQTVYAQRIGDNTTKWYYYDDVLSFVQQIEQHFGQPVPNDFDSKAEVLKRPIGTFVCMITKGDPKEGSGCQLQLWQNTRQGAMLQNVYNFYVQTGGTIRVNTKKAVMLEPGRDIPTIAMRSDAHMQSVLKVFEHAEVIRMCECGKMRSLLPTDNKEATVFVCYNCKP
jgi:hypothetical protein